MLAEILEDCVLLLEPVRCQGLKFELRIDLACPSASRPTSTGAAGAEEFLANAVKFTEHGTVILSAAPAPAPYSVPGCA